MREETPKFDRRQPEIEWSKGREEGEGVGGQQRSLIGTARQVERPVVIEKVVEIDRLVIKEVPVQVDTHPLFGTNRTHISPLRRASLTHISPPPVLQVDKVVCKEIPVYVDRFVDKVRTARRAPRAALLSALSGRRCHAQRPRFHTLPSAPPPPRSSY